MSTSEGFAIDDVRIVRIPNDVSGVHWRLTYDAVWRGSGEPSATRCRWRVINEEGEVAVVGGIVIDDASVDDAVAGEFYPDEIPGVPAEGEVTC